MCDCKVSITQGYSSTGRGVVHTEQAEEEVLHRTEALRQRPENTQTIDREVLGEDVVVALGQTKPVPETSQSTL